MKTLAINIYQFNELNKKAQQKAIDQHREFLLSTMSTNDFISGDPEYDTKEQLLKIYTAQFTDIEENDELVIESIEFNEYYFFADGNLANVTKFCSNHEKAGLIELKIGDDIYSVI